jgi:PIN domain nuclease of toxin-antitoxin system
MISTKKINEWSKILLDTSIILWFLKSGENGTNDTIQKVKFIHKLIYQLCKDKKTFYISAITLSEIKKISDNTNVISEILKHLNTQDVEIISFDEDIAKHLHQITPDILQKKSTLNKFADNYGMPQNDYATAREWITRDMMIIASGSALKVDIVLTMDSKAFINIADELKVPCIYAIEENFVLSTNKNNIFSCV